MGHFTWWNGRSFFKCLLRKWNALRRRTGWNAAFSNLVFDVMEGILIHCNFSSASSVKCYLSALTYYFSLQWKGKRRRGRKWKEELLSCLATFPSPHLSFFILMNGKGAKYQQLTKQYTEMRKVLNQKREEMGLVLGGPWQTPLQAPICIWLPLRK